MNRSAAPSSSAFYFGNLLSSVGNRTFAFCLIAFMLKSGFSLAVAASVLGVSRFIPPVVNFLFGHLSDRVSARKMVVVTEIAGAVSSIGLFLAWTLGPSIPLLTVFATSHATAVALQGGAKAKLSRALANETYDSVKTQAIWLNATTYGAGLFAGILAFLAVTHLDFHSVILFDMATFVVNGVILLSARLPLVGSGGPASKTSALGKVETLFQSNRPAVIADLILATAMAGTNAFVARLSGESRELIPLLMMLFGLAVWLAAFIERETPVRHHHVAVWGILAVSFGALGFAADESLWLIIALVGIKDTAYWVLYHRYTAQIQHAAPQALMASVVSARLALTIGILCLGEIVVGMLDSGMSIEAECYVRLAVCLAGAALAARTGQQKQA